MQYHENVKLSTRDGEEYTGHIKLFIGFYSSGEPEIEEILDGSPTFASDRSKPLPWSFFRFWSTFIGMKVSIEEEHSILCILYCYSLQQHIFLAF